MNNDNPAEMSNSDLEKDMQQRNQESNNQRNVKKSTAAEGELISPSDDKNAIHHVRTYTDDERDLDEIVHEQSGDIDSQDGSLPDPEELDNWERRDDPNKISG